jgi:DNA-binding IclR family transcriptional regulator
MLDFFAAHPTDTFTLSELSRRLDISLASALAVLQALTSAGYLVRHPRHKTYRLGPSAVGIGHAALTAHRIVDVARREMAVLAAELTTEIVATVAVGDQMRVLATEGRPRRHSAYLRIGQCVPLIPPVGTVFLAWESQREVDAWRERLWGRTDARERPDLDAGLPVVRERGYAVGLESDARVRLGEVLVELADHPKDPQLLEAVTRLVTELGDRYELLDIADDQTYDVVSIAAPVFEATGDVALAITANGLGPMTGAELTSHAQRITGITRLLTRLNDGREPSTG